MQKIMQNMHNLVIVLQRGNELSNPVTWKNRQALASCLLALLGAALAFAPEQYQQLIGADELNAIVAAIAAVAGLVNGYLVLATSRKVGIGQPDPPVTVINPVDASRIAAAGIIPGLPDDGPVAPPIPPADKIRWQ